MQLGLGVGGGLVQHVRAWAFQGQCQKSADSEQMGRFQVLVSATKDSLCGWRLEVGVGGTTVRCGWKDPSAEVTS